MMAMMNPVLVRLTLLVLPMCVAGYILGPTLYWHLKEGVAAVSRSYSSVCAPCVCDCSSQPVLSIPEDCSKRDPGASEDTEKKFSDLLSEELNLWEAEALERQQKADMALLESKKITSSYQKEADKCNSGMETCEEAREKSEAAFLAQKKLTAMWELRALRLQQGWKEGMTKSHAQIQSKVQAV